MRTGYWVGLLLACVLKVNAGDVPYAFNYQGVLRGGSGEMLAGGPKKVAFRLYDSAVAGETLWGREFSVQLETNGLFNVELSDSGAGLSSKPYVLSDPAPSLSQVVATSPALYLGLTVVGNAEIAPRQQLLSVPYALMAGDVKSASGSFTVAGELAAGSGAKVTGNVEASTVTVGDASKNVTLKASALGCLEVQNLNVPGNASVAGNAAVGGNATVSGNATVAGNATVTNLTVNGTTKLSGTVQAFAKKNLSSQTKKVTFDNSSTAAQELLAEATTDGFIVISVYWGFVTDGDEDGTKAYGDFTFKLGSDTRTVRCGQYIDDMNADWFHHYEIITLPVRKGETVSFAPDSTNWFADHNTFSVEMTCTFVPFGVSQ